MRNINITHPDVSMAFGFGVNFIVKSEVQNCDGRPFLLTFGVFYG